MDIWGGNDEIQNAISVPGIDVWIYAKPHEASRGGDIYYLSTCGAGRVSRFMVADVSGHGAAASELAERLRSMMRKHINTLDQSLFTHELNSEFSRLACYGLFATAVLTTYYAPTDELVVCNAGNPPPAWYHAATSTWDLLESKPPAADRATDMPLGVVDHTDYTEATARLEKGDLVVLCTDWLTDLRGPDGRRLGTTGLRNLLAELGGGDPARLSQKLLDSAAVFTGDAEPRDDRTLMVLHHNGADPPKQSALERLRVLGRMLGISGGR